jgi:hypothetical protein
MRAILALLGFAAFAAAAQASEVPLARATALQPPVWVVHEGKRAALAPGAEIFPGNRYETGSHGRLHIELADGGIVKLGENASFELPRAALLDEGDAGSVFKGALKVLKGAFRYTTRALDALRRREIDVYVGPTITAGIRGTDIWGKSDDAQALLCLLEGKIDVASPGHPAQRMEEAKTFYVVPSGQAPLPVRAAPKGSLAKWVPQTELLGDDSAQFADGHFELVLGSFADADQAKAYVGRLSDAGYAAAVETAARQRTQVTLDGFTSRGEALRFANTLPRSLREGKPSVIDQR